MSFDDIVAKVRADNRSGRVTEELNAEDWERVQDLACQFHLGVNRVEFLAIWHDGGYDWDEPVEATSVAMLFSDDELQRDA